MHKVDSGRAVFRAAHYRTGVTEEFLFENGTLTSRSPVSAETDLVFGPGFLDLQCNGYAGIDYNSRESTPEQIADSVRAMWRNGCTLVLPTVITAAPEKLEALIRNLIGALSSTDVRDSVPGFHLEGPFISPEEGARGAHPLAAVRPPDKELWYRLQHAAEGMIRLVTLAPEITGAMEFISLLRQESVLPAIGHTMAGSQAVRRATDVGALMSTHLGNGCPQMMHRHSNPLFAQLGEDRLAASVIADGVHLPTDVVRSISRVKGLERTLLVTDAMAAAGAPSGRYTIGELCVEVGEDRVVRQPGSPNFAGSALTMDLAVSRFAAMAGVSLADAWDAASVKPAQLFQQSTTIQHLNLGQIIAEPKDGTLRVVATFRDRQALWLNAAGS